MSNPDKLEQNAPNQPIEYHAPEGTYEFLTYLEGGLLGNPRTKHRIEVYAGQGDSDIDVKMRRLDQSPYLFPHTFYEFNIDSTETVRDFTGRRVEAAREPIIPLPESDIVFDEAMIELSSAKNLASRRR